MSDKNQSSFSTWDIREMAQATEGSTPEERLEKLRLITAILEQLLEKMSWSLGWWSVVVNAGKLVDAIRAIIVVLKSKASA